MSARSTMPLLFALLLALVLCAPLVGADWAGRAEVVTESVHVNFTEGLKVAVTNDQAVPLEVVSVALTINWEGMPTLYEVFKGSRTLQPGETTVFTSPPTRMPNVQPGTYTCFAGVIAKGPDGVPVEHRYYDSVTAAQFDFSYLGIPEEVLIPGLLTLAMLLLTALIFRWDRVEGWPPLRARPRWTGRQRRM